MKQLFLAVLVLLSFQSQAQEDDNFNPREERREHLKNISAEDMAELKTKKMTLHLDLTNAQQSQVKQLLLKEAQNRKAQMAKHEEMKSKGEKPTPKQRIEHQKARLDKQIEMKKQLKNILNIRQYEKYEAALEKRTRKQQKRHPKKD